MSNRKKSVKKIPKIFKQSICNHDDCKAFNNQFLSSTAFEEWLENTQQDFRKLKHEQRVNFINGCISWKSPQNSTRSRVWEADDCKKRYLKTYEFQLPSMVSGFGSFKVCKDYFKYILAIGPLKLSNMIAVIWEHRKNQKLFIKSNQAYKGYKNRDDEPAWMQSFCDWAITHKNLTRSHYVKDKETVHFELDGDEQETWSKLWVDWMKFTSSRSMVIILIQTYQNQRQVINIF